MEERGCLILRTICKYMKTEVVFPLLAEMIGVGDIEWTEGQTAEDKRFASLFIQMMNVILLTSEEVSSLCRQLRSCFSVKKPSSEGQALFDRLYDFL